MCDRVPVTVNSMHRIVVEDNAPIAVSNVNGTSEESTAAAATSPQIAFNMIDQQLYRRIQSMRAHGSYGSKIETLMKHLLFIQQEEPGAKSIVFSAWADSLHSTHTK